MNRAVTWIVLVTAVGAATGLFLLKNQVQFLEAALRAERGAILSEHKAIEVLEAEWSYLNSPERLARLAGHFLDLEPLTVAQTLRIDAIPIRSADFAEHGAPAERGAPVPRIKPTLATVKASQ